MHQLSANQESRRHYNPYFDSIYGPCPPLDTCLINHYEHCSTGFLSFDREPGDDPLLDIIEAQKDQMFPMQLEMKDEDFPEVVEYYETMQQLCIWG